jgi:hypothetical protein
MVSGHVPSEFVGRARALRARIGADDDAVGPAISRILAPLEARRRRSAIFRADQLIDAERAFRALPAVGRLSLHVQRDRHGLRIEEYRAAAGMVRFCEWSDAAAMDADVGIVRVELNAVSWGRCYVSGGIVVSVSLHALSRRYQRGFDTSDAAILAELKQLALMHPTIVESLGDFSIGGDGGRWCGEVGRNGSAPLLAIRTFTPAGAPVTGTAFAAVGAYA